MKKYFSLLIFLVLLSSLVSAQYFVTEEAETIFTSESLTIKQDISGGAEIQYPSTRARIEEFNALSDMFPKDSFRQTITKQSYSPNPTEQSDGLLFTWAQTKDTDLTFDMEYTIETQNAIKIIDERVPFPLTGVPNELERYLEATEKVDINNDIINQASKIASGKDDAFDVVQSIAFWIFSNIDYDISTISVHAQQKASWVLENRKGVCDESTVLFMSMVRSLGIPARFASGIAFTNSDLFDESWLPHAWAEVYFPEHGWVPFDLTYAQFGFVDAGHIKYKDSVGSNATSTSFSWKANNVNAIQVFPLDMTFDTTIKQASGKVKEDFFLIVDTYAEEVKQGSYNLISIRAVNNADHYVSSVLTIAKPNEVAGENRIPIFLKPGETRDFFSILEVDDGLDPKFIYSMPISVFTSIGTQYDLDFEVADNFEFVSLSDVNDIISDSLPKGKSGVDIACDRGGESFVGENFSVRCSVSNEGNTFLEPTLCFLKSDISSQTCEKQALPIGRSVIFRKDFETNSPGGYEVPSSCSI